MKDDKRKTALYCRVASVGPFNGWAIEKQRDTVRDFAARLGYDDFIEYLDKGYNGLSLDRPAFKQMDADIKAGKIGVVVVHSLDRVSRDYMLTESWINGLEAYNVKLITMDDSHKFSAPMADFLREFMKRRQVEAIHA